ncbi:MAG TPA: UDP-N-acetylglucosamine 1-carboxyvinyltransferase [Candidatus Ornithomonoglobus merdipullorum]|mgnify:CR=1 FL=1|uniref:UDP-N-acetylglucosamine 1-carboxyvinyltransferase n=1 Tax=Candidatus Ornithomonoglobus merdipullorum TaxID=2840895 RepID=A0A9D1SEZ6_9FIRM|nr:UDP-N-acetylglucosamine 1-carboxyvinyltransferase [Candidatus Ornithomonoglobus merdipullorum]
MEKLLIKGGNKLHGEVPISGAKNAAVAILPACILVNGVCRIENLPDIKDVKLFLRILEGLNAKIEYIDKNTVEVDCRGVNSYEPMSDLTRRMRGSSYLMGALLGRFHKFKVDPPGGCDFGTRPIDMHIKCFEAMGTDIDSSRGILVANAEELKGAHIFFDIVSVGATVNAILAAVLAEGTTIIESAAKEPHVVDLANFLNNCGAQIRGAGTDTIKIKGVPSLHGSTYTIIPDQIEAGTFMIAAAATRGDVTITNVIPRHLEIIGSKLIEAGVKVDYMTDSVRVWVDEGAKLRSINFIALPYPGFPTDMQPQLVTFLTTIPGTSTAREGVWEDRFRYVNQLKRLGANIRVEGKLAIIDGVPELTGANVKATDLRAGAAMIIAGLMADGITEIRDIYHIDRGYENFEDKFIALGGDIQRVQVLEEDYI